MTSAIWNHLPASCPSFWGPGPSSGGMYCSGEKEDSLLIRAPPLEFASVASHPCHSSKALILNLMLTLPSGMTSWLGVVSKHVGQGCSPRSGRHAQHRVYKPCGEGLLTALSVRYSLHPEVVSSHPVVANQSKGLLCCKTDWKTFFLYFFDQEFHTHI